MRLKNIAKDLESVEHCSGETTYRDVYLKGMHVCGMPQTHPDWFVYAVPTIVCKGTTPVLTLWWVNHDTEEAVEYCRMGDLVDPTRFPYSMHVDPVRGKELCDARFGLTI